MFNKIILWGHMLIALIITQVAVGQTSAGLNNSTNIMVGTPVSVSVGSIGITNSCLITTAQDADDLRREIDVEMNKVKSDLCLQNQRTMDSVRDECDKKYHDTVMRISADAENWFGKMKGVLDESRATISDMIDEIGIIVAIVIGFLTIVIGVFGIVLPMLKERKRNLEFTAATKRLAEETEAYGKLNGALKQWMINYDDLKMRLEVQQKDYDKLLSELQNQKKMQANQFDKLQDEMHAAIRKSESDYKWLTGRLYYDSGEVNSLEYQRAPSHLWAAEYAFKVYSMALSYFVEIKNVGWAQIVISAMWAFVNTGEWQANRTKIKNELKDWEWWVSFAEVLELLESAKKGDDPEKDYVEWFKEIYAEYGKPKT